MTIEKPKKGRKFTCLIMMYVYAMFVTITCMWKSDNLQLVSFHIVMVSCMAAYMGANTISKKFQK